MMIPEARREARRRIAGYTEPAVRHKGLKSPGRPTTAFAGEFLDRQAHRWKPSTRETNAGIGRRDIRPAFGGMTVDAVTAEHVRDCSPR